MGQLEMMKEQGRWLFTGAGSAKMERGGGMALQWDGHKVEEENRHFLMTAIVLCRRGGKQ